jgi:Tfp pilus assembly protein PilF
MAGTTDRSGRRVAAVEPDLPTSDAIERVADAYSRGQFCMKTGNDEDAIQAFLEAVKLDPKFADAWHNLAALYERTGQDEKALDAFRKSKSLAQY